MSPRGRAKEQDRRAGEQGIERGREAMMVRWCGMYMRVSEKTKNKRDLMFTDRSLNGSKGVPAAHPSASTLCPQPTPPPPHGSCPKPVPTAQCPGIHDLDIFLWNAVERIGN